MKSLETLFVEYTQAATAAKKLNAEEISEAVKLPTIEQRLAKVKAVAEARGFKESKQRITRKNYGSGRAAVEESEDSRIREYMGRAGCSFREASVVITGKDPGRGATMSESSVKELAAQWKEYCPALSPQECEQLATKGIQP